MIGRDLSPAVKFRCGSQDAAVCRGSRDGTRVHKSHCRHLAVAGLGAFAVGEVSGGVADGQSVVHGRVAGTEAGAAEGSLDDCAGRHEVSHISLSGQIDEDRLRGRIDIERELSVAAASAAQDIGSFNDICIGTARAAGNDTLLHMQLSVFDLVKKGILRPAVGNAFRFDFDRTENVLKVCIHLIDGEGIAGVERKRDHGLDLTQVDADTAVVVSDIRGIQFAVGVCSAMLSQILPGVLIRLPDRRQAGCLCRHDIDTVSVIGCHGSNSGSHKLHDLIFDIAVFKDCADQGQCDVLRADIRGGLSFQIDRNNTGISYIISIAEELLAQLAAALTDSHGAERTVAGVGIGAQDHPAASGHCFTHILMNDRDMRRNIDSAVLFRGTEAKHVVILVDRAAYRAQRVMAVGQHIGKGEFLHARSARCLDDTDKSDIVGCHGVKADPQFVHVFPCIV